MEKLSHSEVMGVLAKLFSLNGIKWILAAAVTGIINFVKAAPPAWASLLYVLLVFIAMDMVTGMVRSVYVKKAKLTSATCVRSLIKLMCYAAVLGVTIAIGAVTGVRYVLSTFVLTLAVVTEGLSILENTRLVWESMGYKWPFDFVGEALEQLRKRDNGT